MAPQSKFIIGIAVIIIFTLVMYCIWVQFCKWHIESQLKHKKELADYYQNKYESLKCRHEYLKRSSARVAQLYKHQKEQNQTTQKRENTK